MAEQLAHDAHQARLLQRRELGEEMGCLGTLGKLCVVERIDLGAQQDIARVDADLLADGGGDAVVVTGQDLDRYALGLEGGDGARGTCFGRIEEGQKAHQHHVALVGNAKLAHAARIGFLRHGNHAQALGVEPGDLLANLGELIFGKRLGGAIDLDKGADLEHFLGSPLGDHLGFALGVGDNYAQATAREIEGHLVDLGIAVAQALAQHGIGCDSRGRQVGTVDDGQVDKVFEAGLEEAVQKRMAQHTRILVAVDVEVALEHDAVLGESAGLVAAQDVHRAEVLDRRQLLDDNLATGEVLGALRQARGHNDGKHLRRDAHGHARGEQQRVDDIALGGGVDGKDGRRHNEHEAYEQHGDARDAAVKRALLAAPVEHFGDAAQVSVRAGGNDKRHGGAVLHGGAGKDDVLAGRERQRGAVGTLDDRGGSGLLDGLALAGERGLDHKQVARGDNAGIGRHHVAGREADHIAGDELIEGDFDALAVAQGAAGVGDQVLEGLGRIAAAGFLDKLHAARYQQHDADDDDRGGVALRLGYGEHVDVERDQCERGEDTGEGVDERVGDAADERLGRCLDGVGANGVQALGCLLGGEAVCRGIEQHEGVLGAMGGGEYGVLGQAGVSGRARRAAALGDSFEYRGGFEHQHRVLLVEGS